MTIRCETIDPERNESEKVLELYRIATKTLSLREQWYAAEMIAMNLGYTLQPDEEHPDSPHIRTGEDAMNG